MHEFDLIAQFFAPLASTDAALGLRDDAALITPPNGEQLVITSDTLNESIHFIGNEPPALIAQKALRVNLSDLAAMGATPLGYTLALSLPKLWDSDKRRSFCEGFASGLASDQDAFGIALFGGDTTANGSDQLSITITALGSLPHGTALKRSGAKEGDLIYVTGTLGDAALGLRMMQTPSDTSLPHSEHCIGRYHLPQPRLSIAQLLRGVASAAMDISDGLMQDIGHMCRASSVGATLTQPSLPLSQGAAACLEQNSAHLHSIISGGDDYELLFTAPATQANAVAEASRKSGVPVMPIGVITDKLDVVLLDANDNPIALKDSGYQHF